MVIQHLRFQGIRSMKASEFFAWCARNALHDNTSIASAMRVTDQTVRNWARRDRVPGWVPLVCAARRLVGPAAFERVLQENGCPSASLGWFKDWQLRHGLRTLQQTAEVFGVKRQAVHNWFARGKIPPHVYIACVAVDVKNKT